MADERVLSDTAMTRRCLLRIGGLGWLGLSLPDLLRAEAVGTRTPERAGASIRSCILIFYYGGPSHLDTWDMKPDAPREVRGEFQSIASNVPGIRVSEHLPRSARVVDRLAIVRSIHHPMTNHNAAAFATLTGRTPARGDLELLSDNANDPPCLGSALSHGLPERRGVPTFVALPHVMYNVVQLPGQDAGFLGSSHNPFQVTHDPNARDIHLGELELPGDISLDRLEHRAALLRVVDDQLRRHSAQAPASSRDVYLEKALQITRSSVLRRAFHLDEEDPRLRDRYGRTKHGQSLVLARRLIERGVRFVTVYDHQRNGQLANWDAHENVFPRHKNDLLPPADQALAALIDDLSQRGLLDSTLVLAMGEFGRTPKINKTAGRDHWPFCFTAVLAGGGIRGGLIHGASDQLGAYPDRDGVTPADLAATLFWRFGLDPAAEIRDRTGRPYRLAEGQPVRALFQG
jgi:hypothetical protein